LGSGLQNIMRSIVLLGLLCGIGAAVHAAVPSALSAATRSHPAAAVDIQQTATGLQAKLSAAPLSAVLSQLQQQSGIQFDAHSTLAPTVLSGHFTARDWPGLVDALLRDFSYLKVWDDRKKKLRRVLILSAKPRNTPEAPAPDTQYLPDPAVADPAWPVENTEPPPMEEPPPDFDPAALAPPVEGIEGMPDPTLEAPAPEEPVPEVAAPEEPVPEVAAPEEPVPEVAAPEEPVPEASVDSAPDQ